VKLFIYQILRLWKFGVYKHYTSLKLLTSILVIPSPKDDIDGSEVAQIYYQEKNMDRIVKYCEKDTIALAQFLLRFNNEALLNDEDITSVYLKKRIFFKEIILTL